MINTHWGGVLEDNSFGTDEFMELVRQLGCKSYINGNVGSGTVQEMSEWVEYLTFEGVSPMADLRKKNGHEQAYRVDYFGVGNENWGCGGNMTPEYYGNLYRRYQTYIRNYNPEHKVFKICCGANAGDFEWTDTVMKTCFKNAEHFHGFMDGISLHYYTVPHDWEHKGSATCFTEEDWYNTLNKALIIENLIKHHTAIMDKYDKEHKVGLIVDEWGTWYDVEPGTNPGFLYQQNTMRDALVAGISLNVFNKHCDRVKMANIAQLVNVLQSVILTEGSKMVKTPTYYVFNMFKYHQDNELLDSFIDSEEIGNEKEKVPNLSESVSIDKDGKIHATLCNLSCTDTYDVKVSVVDRVVERADCEILTGKMDAYNSFDTPENVKTEKYDVEISDDGVMLHIPACSVLHIVF